MTAEPSDILDQRITGRLAGRLAARAQVASGKWQAQIASWQALVELCLEVDDALNGAEVDTEQLLALHNAVLNLGIGTGEWLLHQIRFNQVNLSCSGEKLENLEASLELLRICFERRHAAIPEADIDQVQRRILNVPA